MKPKIKNIVGVVLILLLTIEFYVYFSDFNLVTDRVAEVGITTGLTCIVFFFFYFKKWKYRILSGLSALLIFTALVFYEFTNFSDGMEKIHWKQEIEEYEIIYATQPFLFVPGRRSYFKLRKKYFLDLLYRIYDQQKAELKLDEFKLGEMQCIVEFEETRTEFDLCEKRQLK